MAKKAKANQPPVEAASSGEPTPQKQHLRPAWQPGQSGNPAGRPKGSRNNLSEAFIRALHDDFHEHGVKVIETVRLDKPADYLKIIAAIVPKELNIRDATLEDMSDEELLDSLDRVRSLAAALVGTAPEEGSRTARRDHTARGKPN